MQLLLLTGCSSLCCQLFLKNSKQEVLKLFVAHVTAAAAVAGAANAAAPAALPLGS